jgi:hypothetical protein
MEILNKLKKIQSEIETANQSAYDSKQEIENLEYNLSQAGDYISDTSNYLEDIHTDIESLQETLEDDWAILERTVATKAIKTYNNNKQPRKGNTMVKTNDLKKGTEIMSVQLGFPVKGVMADNKKGNTRLVDVKGSSIGMFDEIGSVYAHDIIKARINGNWVSVQHTKEQIAHKKLVNTLF